MKGSALMRFASPRGCTHDDMGEVSRYLMDPAMHGRARVLEKLLQSSEDERLVALCSSVVFILSQDPVEPATGPWRQLSMRMIRSCAPASMLRWASHMQLKELDGHTESGRVSDYLYRVLCAAEDLWGLRGHFVCRED